jgi:hypothetical protein
MPPRNAIQVRRFRRRIPSPADRRTCQRYVPTRHASTANLGLGLCDTTAVTFFPNSLGCLTAWSKLGRTQGEPMTVVNEAAIRQDIKQWSGLVLTGAWVAVASVALIVVQVAIYLLWPTPETTRGLFEVLIQNPLRGLLALDLLYVVSNLLVYLLYFALAAVLWRVSRSAVVIALAFGVLGMAAYMASPRPVEMLMLARAYAEADAAGQLALLATGEGMRATWGNGVRHLLSVQSCDAARLGGPDVSQRGVHQGHGGVGAGGGDAHGGPVELRYGRRRVRHGLARSMGRVRRARGPPAVRLSCLGSFARSRASCCLSVVIADWPEAAIYDRCATSLAHGAPSLSERWKIHRCWLSPRPAAFTDQLMARRRALRLTSHHTRSAQADLDGWTSMWRL